MDIERLLINMDDYKLPSKLYMPRKSFEFGSYLYNNQSIKNLTKHYLSQIKYDLFSDRKKALEVFWAREHACFVISCKQYGKRYIEYLPGREYTYTLLRDLILKVSGYKHINVLDGGCGSGIACSKLALTGINVMGVDIANSALRFTNAISKEFNVQVNIVQSDLICIPFPDNTFDLTYSFGVLEHYPIKVQEKLFQELIRVSKRFIIILIPNKNSPIYKTMSEKEFKLMPLELVYPEEHHLFPVDLICFSRFSAVSILESSAIHIVPPKIIPSKYLNTKSYKFFENITEHALTIWNGQKLPTWLYVENRCSKEEKIKYGWFSYTVYIKSTKETI